MNKNFFIMTVTALIMALGMSQSVMAKKIEYLGHYYNGKVNKQKIPEGEGGIAIADVAVFGTFNANNITNVKIEEDWIKITGEISFDESDRITVKAGSNISRIVYMSSTIKYIRNEEDLKNSSWVKSHVFQKTLKKDSIVDLASAYADFNVRTKVYALASNPPTVRSQIHAELVPIEISYDVMDVWGRRTGQTAKRQTKIYKIENSIKDTEYRLDNYKDEFGRIWNVSGPTNRGECVGKVTYPDGSYIGRNDSGYVYWKVVRNGYDIVRNEGGSIHILFPDSVRMDCPVKDDFNKLIKEKIIKVDDIVSDINSISLPSPILNGLSNNEITKKIKEKLSLVIPDYDFTKNDLFKYRGYFKNAYKNLENTNALEVYVIPSRDLRGYFFDGKYYEVVKAKKDEAAPKRALQNFKKKYGFDPSVNDVRYIVKVGRNVLGVIDARNEWLSEYGDKLDKISAKLVRDQGASKCYEFYSNYSPFYLGFFWTRNNVITSIHWGR